MPSTERLTSRQKQILDFVEDQQRRTGYVPTLQETADHFGFKSPNSVRQHLRLIEKKGFLHRVPGRSRALVIVRSDGSADPDLVHVPLLGRIPAGQFAIANEEAEAILTLPTHLFRGNRLFALRVQGDSMRGAGILTGDIAVLDAESPAKDGDIAGVLVEDQATLKRFYRRAQGLLLKCENPAYSDIEIPRSEDRRIQILGVLIGVVRRV